MSGKRNIGKTLSLLILFLITIIVILVIFSYFTGLISITGATTHNSSISGVFALAPSNSSEGTLAFSITNLSNSPITNVTFSCPPADFTSATCDNLSLVNNSGPISSGNPIKTNAAGSGSASVALNPAANIATGTSRVTVSVNVTFADGTMKTFPVQLTTQE